MTLLRSWSASNKDEMHRLLHDLVLSGEPAQAAWLPAVDVHESDTSYRLILDLPGVPAQDVRIEMNDGRLTVKGERRSESAEGVNAHRTPNTNSRYARHR